MDTARQFSTRLAGLLRDERSALVTFLRALADFDARRLWVELGYTSLFHYLTRELGMTKGAAFYRKTAAELVQRYPDIVEPLGDGRLCVTVVVDVAKVLTPENKGEILPRFFNLSRDEARQLVAELQPVETPPMREMVTALPAARPVPVAATEPLALGSPAEPAHANSGVSLGAPAPRLTPRPAPPPLEVVPLTAERSRVHTTVSRKLLAKLEQARDALSHSHPNASADEILEVGLDLVLDRFAKRRGLVANPREVPPPPPGSDHVPAHIWREVWRRDGGRCTFPLASGELCGSTHQLELDHVRPKALGPLDRPLTAADFRLRCRPHNIVEARKVFGDGVMDLFTKLGRGPAS